MSQPLTVPPELEDAYRADLAEWRAMVLQWPSQHWEWRDEQSFKRAWLVQAQKLEAERAKLTAAMLYMREHFAVDHRPHDPETCTGKLSWLTQEARDLYIILEGR